jgi:sacsin
MAESAGDGGNETYTNPLDAHAAIGRGMSETYDDLDVIDFGQEEPLTVRLAGLIRSYPRGAGIFKEFIQNADDAGARFLRFIIDHTRYPVAPDASPVERAWAGPSLLVYNDATFTDADFKGIQRIGTSAKLEESWKAGRFGLGFNAAYNLTDYPLLLSADRFVFFDPHRRHPLARGTKPGGGLRLSPQLWDSRAHLLDPFLAAGVPSGTSHVNGTVFRLPLRTVEQALASEITQAACTPEDVREIAELFATFADEVLLFLKSLHRIEVLELHKPGSAPDVLLTVQSEDEENVQSRRDVVNRFVRRKYDAILDDVRHGAGNYPAACYEHRVRVSGRLRESSVKWRLVSRIGVDPSGEVAASMEAMHQFGEKAVPWAGVAARIEECSAGPSPTAADGRLFCFLPLPGHSGLPVHVHGYLDLDSSRTAPFLDPETTGHPAARRQWNETLAAHVVSEAYADLLVHLANEYAPSYQLWPDLTSLTGFSQLCAAATYDRLWERKCIACVGPASPFGSGAELLLPPQNRPGLQEPLARIERLSIPQPIVPSHVIAGFSEAGWDMGRLSPQHVRDVLRTDADVAIDPSLALNPALTKREWVTELLRFCLSDKKPVDLLGVPLLMLEDGLLHTFGRIADPVHIADDRAAAVFSSWPAWLVDRAFAIDTGLSEIQRLNIFDLTPARFAALLADVLTNQEGRALQHRSQSPPNGAWLADALTYLAEHRSELSSKITSLLRDVPLVPDESGVLCPVGNADTPFVLADELQDKRSLHHALRSCGIRWAVADNFLLAALREFANAFSSSGLVRWLTGPYLVEALAARESAGELPGRYDGRIHDELIDFVFDGRWRERYTDHHTMILKRLRFFPTTDDELARVSEPGVFFPTDFRAPDLDLAVRVLSKGREGRWGPSLRALAANKLDFVTYLQSVLLPAYPTMDTAHELTALAWLRQNIDTFMYPPASGEAEETTNVLTLLRGAELVRGTDGRLHRANELYDPNAEVVRKVLGSNALFPDPQAYGPDEQQRARWLAFFVRLDLQGSPSAEDILRCLDGFSKAGTTDAVAHSGEVILHHLSEHWEERFSTLAVRDPATGEDTSFATALTNRRWLRALRTPEELAPYFGAKPPEDRLYRPGEVYPRDTARLVSSQAPVTYFGKVNRELLAAIDVRSTPPIEIVEAHFAHVRNEWSALRLGMSSVDAATAQVPKALQQTLKRIYSYFGRVDSLATDGEPDVEGENDNSENDGAIEDVDRDAIVERYRDVPCLWDPLSATFLLPRHVFANNVSYMEPMRRCLTVGSSRRADAGYAVLGRKAEPDASDICEWLRDLHSEVGARPLGEQMLANVLRAYGRLEQLLADRPSLEVGDLPVPSERATLTSSRTTLVADAPWFRGRFKDEDTFLLHPRISGRIARRLELGLLSERVDEQLATEPRQVSDAAFARQAERLATLIHSEEFRRGLRRILMDRRVADDTPSQAVLDWLGSAHIVPVSELATELTLVLHEEMTLHATGEVPFWIGADGHSFFLSSRRLLFWDNDLAQAMGRRLNNAGLNLLALSSVLRVSPRDVASTLNELRVPPLEDEVPAEAPTPESSSGASSIDFGDDESDDSPLVELVASQANCAEAGTPSANQLGESASAANANEGLNTATTEAETTSPVAGSESESEPGSGTPHGASPDEWVSTDHDESAAGADDRGADHSGNGEARATTDPRVHSDARREPAAESGPRLGAPRERSADRPPGIAGPREPGTPVQSTGPGRQRPKKPMLRKGRAISYVVRETDAAPEQYDPANDEQPKNMDVAKAAVRAVMDFERKQGRRPFEEAHNNPGYDVHSRFQDGERYIEVKGIDGPWTEAGVPLSAKQFEFGRKVGDRFWVYVVEYAREPWRATIHCIQNPAARVTQFRFDHGWREFSEHFQVEVAKHDGDNLLNRARKAIPPVKGQSIPLPEGGEGRVEDVRHGGVVVVIRVRLSNGSVRPYRFDATTGRLMARG